MQATLTWAKNTNWKMNWNHRFSNIFLLHIRLLRLKLLGPVFIAEVWIWQQLTFNLLRFLQRQLYCRENHSENMLWIECTFITKKSLKELLIHSKFSFDKKSSNFQKVSNCNLAIPFNKNSLKCIVYNNFERNVWTKCRCNNRPNLVKLSWPVGRKWIWIEFIVSFA